MAKGKSISKVIAVFLTLVMVLGMIPVSGLIASAREPGDSETTARAALDESTVVDPPTHEQWEESNAFLNDTRNVGCIWTDKSVFNSGVTLNKSDGSETATVEKSAGADFLVMLSALSSAAEIEGQESVPLDILIVMDTSGSMDDTLENRGMGYVETYDISTFFAPTYYALVDGQYVEIEEVRAGIGIRFDHWELNGQRVEPKTSANDTNPDHIQFYEYREIVITKMDALQSAVNSFIDYTAETNAEITDKSMEHRISLIEFAGSSDVLVGLDEEFDAANLKREVDRLNASGSTGADYAMDSAVNEINRNARDNAKQVVIFFTDGEPNHQNGFDGDVANDAISSAKTMKDNGVIIYSIGVFEDADPTDIEGNFNRYMHGVSSNYPNATGYEKGNTGWPSYDEYDNLGQRAEDSDYYKAASDAEELNNIFQEIADEISREAAQYPTYVEQGNNGGNDGYITFNDQLGDYMKVDGFTSIVFAGVKYDLAEKTTEGNTDTYIFNGDNAGNDLYPGGNLSEISIKVTRSDSLSVGDIVEVKIPAGLIPLKTYDVKVENGVASTTASETYPIRIFYEASLKDGVAEATANPDEELAAYMAENTVDGKVMFYSNAYAKGSGGAESSALTTSGFNPAVTNDFYYFTENTPLYTDEDCTIPATRVNQWGTYYYKTTYYEVGNPIPQTMVMTVPGSSGLITGGFVENGRDGVYVPAGTPKLAKVSGYIEQKTENVTGTASDVISPSWSYDQSGIPESERTVTVALGNNGRIGVEIPGALSVTKTAEVTDGFDGPKDTIDEAVFSFEVSFTDAGGEPVQGPVDAKVLGTDGTPYTWELELKDGKGTFTLKNGEVFYAYGLDAGTQYTVTEPAMPAGFEQTGATGNTGTIAAGQTAAAAFTNTYSAQPVTLEGTDAFKVQKSYDYWNVTPDENFTFTLQGFEGAPMPAGSDTASTDTITVQNGEAVSFGDIEYTRPGAYTYNIRERVPSVQTPGIDYSLAAYRVTVTVTDDGEGNLSVESSMLKVTDDDGTRLDTPQPADTAVFTNDYSADTGYASITAQKDYTDLSGGNPLTYNMFSFRLTRVTPDAPMPANAAGDTAETANSQDGEVIFGNISYDVDDVGSYIYRVQEVLPAGADAENSYTLDGMQYDPAAYYAKVDVSVDNSSGSAKIVTNITWWTNEDCTQPADTNDDGRVAFTNVYDPEDAAATVGGTKTLTGRDMYDGEEFTFSLAAGNQATEDALASDAVILGGDKDADSMTASVTGGKNGNASSFSFDEITFSRTGRYVFTVKENIPDPLAGGMTYDRHTCTVTINVTNENGKLTASAPVYSGGAGAAFENRYASSGTYGGLTVSKTLYGRDMNAGEFEFTIEPKTDSDKPVPDSDKSFSNKGMLNGETDVMTKLQSLQFDQNDAGKTYTYVIQETLPEDDDSQTAGIQKSGVTYDQSVYEAAITVTDDNNGGVTADTVITKVKNADGTSADETVTTAAFLNSYKAKSTSVTDVNIEKTLEDHEWEDSYQFKFTIEAVSAPEGVTAPMPVDGEGNPVTEVTVGKPESSSTAEFGFGTFSFDTAGEYVYKIKEVKGDIPGVVYATNEVTLRITVTDNLQGGLVANTRVNGHFTNGYTTEDLDFNEAGGFTVSKVLYGRDMEAGQFEFSFEPADQASADKLGIEFRAYPFYNVAGLNGVSAPMSALLDMVLEFEDVGTTYTYKFKEVTASGNGYTCDENAYTLAITAIDNGDGTLSARVVITNTTAGTVITDKTVSKANPAEPGELNIEFVNSYSATTDIEGGTKASVSAGKELAGRHMKDGEFEFAIKPVNGGTDIQTAENSSDGSVIFADISYTTESLKQAVADGYASKARVEGKDVYTVNYTAYEKTENLPGGVSATLSSVNFTVTVTDNGDGTLTVVTNYPDGGIVFKNVYSTGDPIKMSISGTKKLTGGQTGLTLPDISGKYTFTLKGDADVLENDITASNDNNGNVVFDEITFTLDMLDDVQPAEDNSRSRDFVFTVEESGEADGVTNDPETVKTFTITLKDDGKGNLTVTSMPEGGWFSFTNTYDVEPVSSSVTDQIVMTKELTGRELVDGEFKFELVENGSVVANGTNDAEGNILFDEVTYTQPGEHTYTVREVKGAEGIGVTYDTTTFTVHTSVTDNAADGTLTVKHTVVGDAEVVFHNSYKAQDTSVTLGASKRISGMELQENQFTFRLTDDAGQVLSEAKNNASGSVTFDKITFTEPGVYTYTISEVNDGQENITYDESTYDIKVTVTDDGKGHLTAEIEGDDAVFTNTYTEPQKPAEPEDPNPPVVTGDSSFIPWLTGILLASALGLGFVIIRCRKKSK